MASAPITSDQLGHLLTSTFTATTADSRSSIEEQLNSIELQPGTLSLYLPLIANGGLDLGLRQAATLRLKNVINEHWYERESDNATAEQSLQHQQSQQNERNISPQDRETIKQHIFELICTTPNLLANQLLEAVYTVAKHDFPEKWSGLYPIVIQNLQQNQDAHRLHGAVSTLRMLFKKYQYKNSDARAPLYTLVSETFPRLLELLQMVVGMPIQSDTAETIDIMRIVCKIFYISCQLAIPDYLKQQSVLTPWITALQTILLRNTNQNVIPDDTDNATKAQHPLWKAKKSVAMAMNRMFTVWGIPKNVSTDSKPFAEQFYNTYAESLLGTMMQLLKEKADGKFVSPRVLHSAYIYVDTAVGLARMWAHLKPHTHFLIVHSILPTLCINDDDLELWTDDHQEYIRRSLDMMEEFHDPRIQATTLLLNLLRWRTRHTLQLTLTSIDQVFTQFAAEQDPNKKNYRLKEGAMRMFGSLRKLLLSKDDFKQAIEQQLTTHILPEFSSPHGYMRLRACFVVGQYYGLQYANEQAQQHAVQCVCRCLTDPDLAVRLEACVSISKVIYNKRILEYLRPNASVIFEQFFILVDEMSTAGEEVIATLNQLISSFSEEVIPHAKQLIEKLVRMFMEYSAADPDNDEAALTAQQCLRTINTVLFGLESQPQVYYELEPIIAPMLPRLFVPEGIEYLEDMCEMIMAFTWLEPTISDNMWTCLPQLFTIANGWAEDYVSDVMTPIDNYISRGNDRFLTSQNPNYLQLTFSMCEKLINDTDKESEAQHACLLLETVITNSRGKIDQFIQPILALIVPRIYTAKRQMLKFLLVDVWCATIWYNPTLWSQVMKQVPPAELEKIMRYWVEKHNKSIQHSYKHLKLSILALTTLFTVPLQTLPPIVQAGNTDLLVALVKLLTDSSKLQVVPKKKRIGPGGTTVEDDDDDVLSGDDDEDGEGDEEGDDADAVAEFELDDDGPADFADIDDDADANDVDDLDGAEGEESLTIEQQMQRQLANDGVEEYDEGEEPEGDEDDDFQGEWDDFDEEDYVSPLDEIDEFITFSGMFTSLEHQQPPVYSTFIRHLPKPLQKKLKSHLVLAKRRQKERDEEAAKELQKNAAGKSATAQTNGIH